MLSAAWHLCHVNAVLLLGKRPRPLIFTRSSFGMNTMEPKTPRTVWLVALTLQFACAPRTMSLQIYDTAGSQVIQCHVIEEKRGAGHGTVQLHFPNGEVATGRFTTLRGGSTTLTGAWSAVYGTAIAAETVMPNEQVGSFIANGDQGTLVECEYRVDPNTNHGNGVCKDNKERFYKFVY